MLSLSFSQMLSLDLARPLFLSSRGSICIFLSLSLSSSHSLSISQMPLLALVISRYCSLFLSLRLWGSPTCSFFLCLDHFYTDTDGFPEHMLSLALHCSLLHLLLLVLSFFLCVALSMSFPLSLSLSLSLSLALNGPTRS